MSDFWVEQDAGWDKLVLGGITFPGLARVRAEVSCGISPNRIRETEATKDRPAKFKLTLSDQGVEPASLNVELRIWEVDHWEDIKGTLPKFVPRNGDFQGSEIVGISVNNVVLSQSARRSENITGRDAFDISHPMVKLLGIKSVVIRKIAISPVEGQVLSISFDMIQYFPPSTYPRTTHGGSGPEKGIPVENKAPNVGNQAG